MPNTAIATVVPALLVQPDEDFTLHDLRVFTSIPDHPDIGVAALNGMVVIHDEKPLHMEGIVDGAFYVRESQHPPSAMGWQRWLDVEAADRTPRAQPRSLLKIRREVVQVIQWPNKGCRSVRLSNGHIDGPYQEWAFGTDFVGRVIGIYDPSRLSSRASD